MVGGNEVKETYAYKVLSPVSTQFYNRVNANKVIRLCEVSGGFQLQRCAGGVFRIAKCI